MKEFEDLTGQTFGYLKVLSRAPDSITPSGQKKKRWLCKCTLCGNEKIVGGQNLKRGMAKSCGCLRAIKGKASRNHKICVICEKEFECPESTNKVTCSDECRKAYASERAKGHEVSNETKMKISLSAQGRDMEELQSIAVEAAKQSPKSGRFETNVNAIDWHLISPEGKHYYFHSLNNWLRINGNELFGCQPDTREFNNVRSGLSGAKRAMMGGNYPSCTYKGWRVIPTDNDTG